MAEAPYGEETTTISLGGGLFTADLPSAIPENYCAQCDNAVPTGTSVENRFGFKKSTIGFSEINLISDDYPSFTYFGPSRNPDSPVLMWGRRRAASSGSAPGNTYELHLVREGSPYINAGGTGYFSLGQTSLFIGAVNYNGVIYAFFTDKVTKITAVNWGTPSITSSTVLNTPPLMEVEPVHFFDRLWTAGGNKLYFTDAVSSPGGLPETWDTSTNFISIVGRNGPGKIYKIIPVGSRIYIFTSAGLFSLTVAGSPTDWYLRPLDEKAIVNSYECAFEQGGLIYYVTLYGVYVTNGSDSVKLSGSIENFFLVGNFESGPVGSKQTNIYRINYLDGGMVVSITSLITESGGTDIVFDSPNCFVFYSRIGSIAWSEWSYETPTPGDTELIGVVNVADSVLSYINTTPLSYMMVLSSPSTPTHKNPAQRELMVYDGLRDEWTNPGWVQTTPLPPSLTTQADIVVKVATRYMDGSNVLNFKQLKYSFIEMYCSDEDKLTTNPSWYYEWRTEAGLAPFESDSLSGDNLDKIANLGEFTVLKLRAGFYFRIAQFYMEFDTNNADTVKIKDIYLKQDTVRDGPYFIQ